MTKIKFAVLGCGHIGKRHISMIVNNSNCQLTAICDNKPKNEIDGLDVYNNTPFFKSIEDLLNSKIDFDVLAIATPNGLHENHALLGLKHGKHIVVEKPMALTKAGCEKIIFESFYQQKQVFCVMQNRYSPPSAWLKNIVHNNVLGKIFMVQVNCYWNRDERYYTKKNWHGTKDLDGGTLFTQFSHFIDIMFWLFGDITNIKSKLNSFNHKELTDFEDSGFVNFDFLNGGMGSLNYSTSCYNQNLESSITIIAENGTVKVGGQYMNEVEICNIKNYTMPILAPSNPPNDYGAYKGSAANHHYIFENVVDVLTGNASITTNALEGLKVVEIIERIYNS
jgi:UDP-N-acetyl-2-amino-2-deoxyglucuronate dehydrogenase